MNKVISLIISVILTVFGLTAFSLSYKEEIFTLDWWLLIIFGQFVVTPSVYAWYTIINKRNKKWEKTSKN